MCKDPKIGAVALTMPEVSLEVLNKHNVNGDNGEIWLAFDGVVYEVSQSWIERHPGGANTILSCAGKDATVLIRAMHSPQTVKLIQRMMKKVGFLKEEKAALTKSQKRNQEIAAEFKKLHEHAQQMGWFQESLWLYVWDVIRVASIFAVALWCLLYAGRDEEVQEPGINWSRTRWLILGSMLLGFYYQSVAFFGHDAGHNSILGDRKKDFWIGLFMGNVFTGIGMSWWKSTHNCHHVNTNHLEDDPDVQHVPLFCFDKKMVDDWYSNYHGRLLTLGSLGRILIRYQHWYFYPVMAVARVNLYIQTVIHLVTMCPMVKNENDGWKPMISKRDWSLEVAGLLFFYTWSAAILYSLGPVEGAICILVAHATAGVLHVQILLSHVVMDFCVKKPKQMEDDSDIDFYEWQALSTMDIACPSWMNWFHGGLQFQLEHHLFPRVHRKDLPKLIPLVNAIFEKYDVPVTRLGFIEANVLLFNHMAMVGEFIADKWSSKLESAEGEAEALSKSTDKAAPQYIKIKGDWYDISGFIMHHPGGKVIEDFVGRDATEVFTAFHLDQDTVLKRVKKMSQPPDEQYRLKTNMGEADASFSKDFQALVRDLRTEGFFISSKPMMIQKMVLTFALFVGGWHFVFESCRKAKQSGDTTEVQWSVLILGAALVALFFQQSGFLLHDFMHNNWFRNRKVDQAFGRFFGAFCVGISGCWWRDEHWIHHVFTNTYEDGEKIRDIQIAEDVWAQNAALLQFFDGSLPESKWVRPMKFLPLPVAAMVVRYQAFIWLPLTVILGRVNIIAVSFMKETQTSERLLQIAHMVWFGGLSYMAFPDWKTFLAFNLLVSTGQGVLHVQLLISHYVKPWHDLKEMQESSSWYKRQIMSTVNISPFFSTRWLRSFDSKILDTWDDCYAPIIDDWFHGGLNLHIEHHTMPSLPRNSLRRASSRVKALCQKHHLRYDERHFCEAVWDTLVQLQEVGKQAHFTSQKVKNL